MIVLKIFTFIRYLDNTAIDYLPYAGLLALTKLHLLDTPNLWDIPDGIVGIPTLQKVRVASERRFLCCAFEFKRAHVGTFVKVGHFYTQSFEELCAQPTTVIVRNRTMPRNFSSTTESSRGTVSPDPTTKDPFLGFGKRRKRRDAMFEGFLAATAKVSNVTTKKAPTVT